ncbi:Na+-transporting NADH:ubiquinone oxidoreductase, subunit NqrB [Hyella patelloides LEGE 07179]|uniref:Na+-transporting NADH:ubiquinone oxidoreductase, subunit NqrB n=1 Tax=Hyella patelloides LEGE 07179 TaxID=945734 RepID=A0A563W4J3_9CYAN|nr:RnfABCDGE type electron transport complex subunit D [Hyella patelloides]VEP18604.1 Na+-transporting NADH:ubiquinone oxidoreductase, subunit NqrB [Hyella patelloides LEGE 07179]
MIILKNRRDYQIVFLSCFLFIGLFTRDWTIQPFLIAAIALSCLVTQWILSAVVEAQKKRDIYDFSGNGTQIVINSLTSAKVLNSLRSALITALGLCLLLRGNSYQTMMLAGFLAIASKFLFRYRSKHFFNPANFGIISALLLTNDAWVSPGQWGTDWWYLLLFAGMGGVILKKVGRWDTSVAFLLVYAGLEAMRNLWLGWSWDVWLHQLSSGSLLLFALFMLTDPRSIPNATMGRIFWAIAIAFTTVILQDYFYITTAIFWALFIISPLTILLDLVWSAPRFMWTKPLINW